MVVPRRRETTSIRLLLISKTRDSAFVFLVFFVIISFRPSVLAATNQQDKDSLIALYNAWSQNPSSWDTSTDPCDNSWIGILCDASNTSSRRVFQLLLINQGLDGSLPSEIGNLTELTTLDLSSNTNLRGSLPPEIGNLKNLENLFLQFCNFSGDIPPEVGNLTALQYLGLTSNAFTGTLPSTIGKLNDLVWLDVANNLLSGTLPVSTTNGPGLDNLTNAQHFHLENNSFSGEIPSSIFNNEMKLLHLILHTNKFTGNIPDNIGDLLHVEIIRLDSNSLSGSIPSSINTITNLTTLRLNHNSLSGPIPDLSNNTKLQMLYLGNNPFNATDVPSWITELKSLYLLSMDSSNLIGSIPPQIFNSSTTISNVTLANNSLNGTLDLSSASSTLLFVDVTNNSLSGVNVGSTAAQILIQENQYCTTNPNECTKLESNTSTSANASSTSTCSNTCQDGYRINPRDSTGCKCTRPVVGNVEFIATKVASILNFNTTTMEANYASYLNASLGVTINSVSQVVLMVTSVTEATILIFPPSGSEAWNSTVAAFISYYLKNEQLTFPSIGPLICGFTGTPYATVVVVNGLSLGAKIGIAVAVVVLVVGIMIIAIYARKQKKRAEKAERLNKPFAAWIGNREGTPNIPQLKGARWFSLEELRVCTNNFGQNNEIGEGGYGKVYKGFLLSGERVAIKRARADSLQGAAEFKTEIELLSRIHHRNLVGLIGFCFEEGEQMLVYEYIPNGTLREALSGKTGINLDWNMRMSFALASARGIAYLHFEANPPVIHRDIKSSNILLDDKLVAKVADFGLSLLAPVDDEAPALSTQVKGTLGYLDPDYFMTNKLTEKSDVYSFGVVLLELVTGRLPIQDGKYVVREARVAFARGGIEELVEIMIDPDLTDYPPTAMAHFVELALTCVNDSPDLRPTMVEVVKEIEVCFDVPSARKVTQFEEPRGQVYADELLRKHNPSPFDYSGSMGIGTQIEPK